jgi:hypothetical protein
MAQSSAEYQRRCVEIEWLRFPFFNRKTLALITRPKNGEKCGFYDEKISSCCLIFMMSLLSHGRAKKVITCKFSSVSAIGYPGLRWRCLPGAARCSAGGRAEGQDLSSARPL